MGTPVIFSETSFTYGCGFQRHGHRINDHFQKWDADEKTIDGADEKFVGTWIFKPEHEVIHHFVSGTPGKELPDEVRRLTPGNQTGKYDGDVVRPTAATTTRVHVDGGSWVFTGWNNDSSVIDGDDVVFTGGWRFMEDTYIDIAGVKTWIDNDDALGKRPGSITVNLLRNGEVVDQRTVTADMDWAYAFEHLRETDDGGKAYAYAIAEVNVPGYFAITKDYDLINTLLPQSADLPRRNATWSKPDFSGYTREELSDTNLNLNCNHLRASFPPCLCLAVVNDALHRLPPLCLGRTKNLLRICSLLD